MSKPLPHLYRSFDGYELNHGRGMIFQHIDNPGNSVDYKAQIDQVKKSADSEIRKMVLGEGKSVGDATMALINRLDDIQNNNEVLQVEGKDLTQEEKDFNKDLYRDIAEAQKELADSQKEYTKYEELAQDITTIRTELTVFEPTGPVKEEDLRNPAAVKLIATTLQRFEGYDKKLGATKIPDYQPTLNDLQKRIGVQIDKFKAGLNILHTKAHAKLTEVNGTIKWLRDAVQNTSPELDAKERSKEIGEKVAKLSADRVILDDLATLVEASGNTDFVKEVKETQSNAKSILESLGVLDTKKDPEARKELATLRENYNGAKKNYLDALYPKQRNSNYYTNLKDAQNRLAFTEAQYINALKRYTERTGDVAYKSVLRHVLEAQMANVGKMPTTVDQPTAPVAEVPKGSGTSA